MIRGIANHTGILGVDSEVNIEVSFPVGIKLSSYLHDIHACLHIVFLEGHSLVVLESLELLDGASVHISELDSGHWVVVVVLSLVLE